MLLNQACLAHPLLRAPRTINEAEIGGPSTASESQWLRRREDCDVSRKQFDAMQTRGVVVRRYAAPYGYGYGYGWTGRGAKHYCS